MEWLAMLLAGLLTVQDVPKASVMCGARYDEKGLTLQCGLFEGDKLVNTVKTDPMPMPKDTAIPPDALGAGWCAGISALLPPAPEKHKT